MADIGELDDEALAALNEFLSNDLNAGIFQLYHRSLTLLDEAPDRKIPQTVIAFEMLMSAYYASLEGWGHEDIKKGYPVEGWRNDTIEVPRDFIRVLVDHWEIYKNPKFKGKLDDAMYMSGDGTAKEKLELLNKTIQAANLSIGIRLEAQRKGQKTSWNNAYTEIAAYFQEKYPPDARTGYSEQTLKITTRKFRDRIIETFRHLGILK